MLCWVWVFEWVGLGFLGLFCGGCFWSLFGLLLGLGVCFVLWLLVEFEFLWLFVFRVGGGLVVWIGLFCFWLCGLALARLFSMLSLVR